MIAIVDYGMGNLNSVSRALVKLGANAVITSDVNDLNIAQKIILPGVGHFASGVHNLKARGLWNALNNAVLVEKKQILGICLGMQLMAEHSEEGDSEGLGWFNSNVVRFRTSDPVKYKVPHIGWNTLIKKRENPLLDGISDNEEFYFVHSYHLRMNNPEDVLTSTIYDYEFTSSIVKSNIFGVQFHPEKSHDAGIRLLKNFIML